MNIINAGSGKIKKKRKKQLLNTYHGNSVGGSPFDSYYTEKLSYLRNSKHILEQGDIENAEFFQSLIGQDAWLFDPLFVERYFLGAKLVLKTDNEEPKDSEYYMEDIPEFPNIELAILNLPKVWDSIEDNENYEYNKSLYRYTQSCMKTPDIMKIWRSTRYGGSDFSLKIHFKSAENSNIGKAVYVPALPGNGYTHIDMDANRWNILSMVYHKKPKKQEVYKYATCSKHHESYKHPDCVKRECFEKTLLQAIKEQGGSEQQVAGTSPGKLGGIK